MNQHFLSNVYWLPQ